MSYFYVSLQDCNTVHAVITPRYYDIVINEIYRAPPGIYEDSVYTLLSSPFTFTTLNDHLPFSVSHIGGLKLSSPPASKKSIALVHFHQSCLQLYREHCLSPDLLWFDYMVSTEVYADKFKETYDRFTKACIPSA